MLKTIIKYVLAGLNVALVGPAGTGKSFIAAQVAQKIGRSFHVNGATAQYVGRYKQDAAAMDRFVPVYIDYDARVEDKIGDADIVERVRAVRTACDLLGIQHVCSYRMIKKATKARAAKATRAEIDRDIIFARLDADTVKQIKAQIATATKLGSN
jgi:cytidylate kinase